MQTTLIVLAAIVLALILFVVTRPGTFRVERRATISAPPQAVFAYMNDFHKWRSWSPWEDLDPALVRTYSGPSSGKGSVYDWSGNQKAGIGRMEITESRPNEKILIDLRFEKPFKAANTTEFTFVPTGSGTTVNWVMHGQNTTMGKVMYLFGGMDKFLGKDFDRGLGNLKGVVESDAMAPR